MSAVQPSVGCVVLTQGTRPRELDHALGSVLRQRGAELDVVVVGNGWVPTGLPSGVRGLALARNVGIPAGRNAGVPAVRGDLLLFLDDDAALTDDDTIARLAGLLEVDPTLGLLQPRVCDRADGRSLRRWVPRLRTGDPARSSDVCAVWEGCVLLPREVFERAGGWPDDFFYGHEGIDLAWRVWDAGLRVRYVGDAVVHHPVVDVRRHRGSDWYRARNRVWLARRRLPAPLGVVYAGTWFGLSALRCRSGGEMAALSAGYRAGMRPTSGRREPIRWRTVGRMTRAGRPPVV